MGVSRCSRRLACAVLRLHCNTPTRYAARRRAQTSPALCEGLPVTVAGADTQRALIGMGVGAEAGMAGKPA